MKKPTITQVSVSDGSALYVNGVLVSKWFTVAQADIVTALGYKSWGGIKADDEFYRTRSWPLLLKDVKKAKKSPSPSTPDPAA